MSSNERYVTCRKIIDGYRVSIPKVVCDELDIKTNDLVNIRVDTQGIDHEPLIANEVQVQNPRRISIERHRLLIRGLDIGTLVDFYVEPTGKHFDPSGQIL